MTKITLITCALALGSLSSAPASGTYIPPTGRIPGKRAESMDKALYALGQKTYEGKMMTSGAGDAAKQKSQLMLLQAKLPANNGTDITRLAGKISDDQVRALEYYISKRFGM